MSPYSWFAAERVGTLLPDAQWRPVFAGALFRANGRGTWGLTEWREAGLADCEARAASHGLGPIMWPDPWPTNDVVVARAMAYADREGCLEPFAIAAMRLDFLEGRDLGELTVVQEAGERRRARARAARSRRAGPGDQGRGARQPRPGDVAGRVRGPDRGCRRHDLLGR